LWLSTGLATLLTTVPTVVVGLAGIFTTYKAGTAYGPDDHGLLGKQVYPVMTSTPEQGTVGLSEASHC
jgi:hypothetical protein